MLALVTLLSIGNIAINCHLQKCKQTLQLYLVTSISHCIKHHTHSEIISKHNCEAVTVRQKKAVKSVKNYLMPLLVPNFWFKLCFKT